MPLKINYLNNGKTECEFENLISLWNILKFLVDSPYLKHYIIENYEGGNTLAPSETWDEEGIMFKEITPSVYFFPYDSIGFIIDDSIHNLTLYIVENLNDNGDYKNDFEILFSISKTDSARLVLDNDKLSLFITLYLLFVIKIGFTKSLLNSLNTVVSSIINDKIESIEYINNSILISIKKISFIIKISFNNDEYLYYKIECSQGKSKKELLKEQDIKNIGFLKKKILKKNKYIPIVFYSVFAILGILLLIFNKKLLILLIILLIIIRYLIGIFKKNAHKFIYKERM